MELITANDSMLELSEPGKAHGGGEIYHNYEVLFKTLNSYFPRDESFKWLDYMQFLQARDYERVNDREQSRQEWEGRVQTQRERLAWVRSDKIILGADRNRLISAAASGIVDAQHDFARFYERRREYEHVLSVAQDEVNTLDTIPELKSDFDRRWRACRMIAHSLDELGQKERGNEELDIAAAAFIAASDRHLAEARRDLSIGLGKVGDAKMQMGNQAGALAAYVKMLDIDRDLAKDKSNAEAQRDLSISLDNIGDVKLRAGDAAGALIAYEESLTIRRARAKDKSNAEAQRDLSISLIKIGDMKLRAGAAAGAFAAYEESLAIRRDLAKDKSNAEARAIWHSASIKSAK
jgi:tetratricopeptide (TPR) repeat protein